MRYVWTVFRKSAVRHIALLCCLLLAIKGVWAAPPGVPDVDHPDTRLVVVANLAVADGSSTNTVKAHIVDEFGNPVAYQEVSFEVNGTFFTAFTNGSGDALLSFSVNTAGNVSIKARVGGKLLKFSNPITVTFVPGPVSVVVEDTYLEVVHDNAIANGTATNRVQAHVTDANGNLIINQPVTFQILSGTGTLMGSHTVNTGPGGEAYIDIVSTVAGQVSIIANLGGLAIVNGSPAVVTFVADAPDLSAGGGTALSVGANNAVANGMATNSVKATVVDANGNPVANQSVEFFIYNGAGLIIGSSTVVTGPNGEAEIQLTSTVAGQVSITAELNGTPIVNGSPAVVTFVADVPDVSAGGGSSLSVVTTNAVANGTAVNSVKATLRDANGNLVANQAVEFFIIDGNGNIVGTSTVTTDANGEAIIEITSTVAGNVSIGANVNGTAIVNGSPAVVTFVADVPDVSAGGGTLLVVVDNNAVANGTAANSVKAIVKDANGNAVANQAVEFFIVDGNGNIVGSSIVTTGPNGEALITLTSTVAGNVSIGANINGSPIVNGSPAVVTFVPDVPDVSAGGGTLLLVVDNNAVANGTATNSVKAIVKDANGNPVANQAVEFFIIDGNGNIVGSNTVMTGPNGEALITVTSTVAGNVSIGANINGSPVVNGSPAVVTFVPDVPDVSAGGGTEMVVVTNNAAANGTATNSVKVVVKDANGNPVPNQTVEFFIIDGTGAIVGSATVTTDANGEATVQITSPVVGNVSLRAEVNGTPVVNGSPAVVTFVPDVPDVSAGGGTVLSVVTTNAIANGTAVNSVKAVVKDANGNPVPNQTVEFFITDGTGTITGSSTVTTDANGEAVIQLTSTVAGNVSIRAEVNGSPIVNGSPAVVTFVPDVPDMSAGGGTELVVVTNNAAANGTATNSIKAVVKDVNGNPVPNQTVEFFITDGTGTIVGSSVVTTNANGEALIEITSTAAGIVRLKANVNGTEIIKGSPAEVVFIWQPDTDNPATVLLVVDDNALADGTEKNSIKAHVVAPDGNVLPNKSVRFRIASGNGEIVTPQPVMTDANGDAQIHIISQTPGQVQFSADVEDKSIKNGSPATVKFVTPDIWVPRVFTPNNDGRNDIIRPIITAPIKFGYFSIYNRWGNLLFSTADPNKGWDGRFKGVIQPNETYIWIITGTDKDNHPVKRRGMFSLVR